MEFSEYRAVIERDHPDLEIVSMRPNLVGWDFFVFDINDAYIYRFPRRRDAVKNLRKEALLLPPLALHLKNYMSARLPEFERLVIDDEKPENSYVCYRKIHGEPWEDRRDADRLADDLSVFLTGVHTFDVPPEVAGYIPPQTSSSWRDRYWSFYRRLSKRVFPRLEVGLRSRSERIFSGFLKDDGFYDFLACLTHSDLGIEHILCDRDGRLSGVIDWEDAFIGDPALDFVGLFIWGGDEFVARVLDRYDVNCGSNFWSRLRFYTLATSFHIIEFGLDIEDERVIADGKNRLRGYVRNYG